MRSFEELQAEREAMIHEEQSALIRHTSQLEALQAQLTALAPDGTPPAARVGEYNELLAKIKRGGDWVALHQSNLDRLTGGN